MGQIELVRETALDEQYAQMYQAAMLIAAAYLASISVVIRSPATERKLHTHLLISVRVRTPSSWTVTWCKKVSVQDTGKSQREVAGLRKNAKAPRGRYITKEIPKGPRDRYPNSTFSALPVEVRDIAIHYEALLAKLRRVAKGNRAMKKAEVYCLERGSKTLVECNATVSVIKQMLSELESSGLRDLRPLTDLINRGKGDT